MTFVPHRLARRACRSLCSRQCPHLSICAGFGAGADRHLGKPIEAAGLLTAIDDVLNLRAEAV